MAQTVNEALIELASDISGEDLSGKYGTTTVDGFNALIEALDGDMSMKDSVTDVIADFGVALKAKLEIGDSGNEPDTPTDPDTPTEPDTPTDTPTEPGTDDPETPTETPTDPDPDAPSETEGE